MTDPMTEGAKTGARELCLYCQYPIANQQEWDDIPPGEGFHLCWGVCSERHDVESLLRQSRSDLTEALKVAGEALTAENEAQSAERNCRFMRAGSYARENARLLREKANKLRGEALAALERIRNNNQTS